MPDLTTALSRATNLVWYRDDADEYHTAGSVRYVLTRTQGTWTLTDGTRVVYIGRVVDEVLPDVVAHQLESWGNERRAKAEADSSLALPGVR